MPFAAFWMRAHFIAMSPEISEAARIDGATTWKLFWKDPSRRTMAGALGAFQGHYATNVPLLCAGTVLVLVPTLLIFVLFQRQIIAALLQGAVKG